MDRPQILIVEDNRFNIWCLIEYLKQLGFNVISALSGEEALEVMANKNADCMLLDINLGAGISGLELMEKFREQERFKQIPIITITAYYGGGAHLELIKKGFTDYLVKPFQMEDLKQILQKHGVYSKDLK